MNPLAAIGLFTVIPVPHRELDRRAISGAMNAWPLVFLGIGALAGVVGWGFAALGLPLAGAVATVAILAAITGGLHLDGLADTADGLGSRAPRERALEIMKRSDIGPMGVISLVLVLLLQISSLASLYSYVNPWWIGLVALCSATSRCAVFFASRGPTARPGGFGAIAAGTPSLRVLFGTIFFLLALGFTLGFWSNGWLAGLGILLVVVVSLLAGLIWQGYLRIKFGGTTGDIFGSIVEVTFTIAVLASAIAGQLVW